MSSSSITPGSRVRLHLAIFLEDGTEAISTFDEEPMELTLGDGTLTSGTEALLIGMSAGAEEQILADGSQLFGTWSEEKLHWLAHEDFPEGESLEPGTLVTFDTPAGAETAGIIKKIDEQRVQVDFNHPLSGRALRIQVRILAVSNPRAREKFH